MVVDFALANFLAVILDLKFMGIDSVAIIGPQTLVVAHASLHNIVNEFQVPPLIIFKSGPRPNVINLIHVLLVALR